MKITKRQLRRIIKEEKAVLEQSWRQNPAKIRRERRQRDRQRMIDTMTFEQLKRKAFDSALGIQGRLNTGQYEYADIWEAEIPMLADYIDAAKVKAAEEGVTYDDIPEVRHNGGIVDLSSYSLGGLEENTMKITKRQLRQIIKEELHHLNESAANNRLAQRLRDFKESGYTEEEAAQEVYEDYGTIESLRKIAADAARIDPDFSSYVYEVAYEADEIRSRGGTMFDEPDRYGGSRYSRY
jgi:hypothetical protein